MALDQHRTSIHFKCSIFCSAYTVDQEVDDVLDLQQISLPIIQDALPLLALVNKMGAPHRVFSFFKTIPKSFGFRDQGPSTVWDAHAKIHFKLVVSERERAMGFRTRTTTALGYSEGQHRFRGRGLWSGVEWSTSMKERIEAMVEEAKRISYFEQHVMEELRAVYVYTTLIPMP